jgi:3-deoxy-D-manno-octulosonic-acid transferase
VAADKIKVTGNMKFDIQDYTDFRKDCTDYKTKLGLKNEDRLWVCGSTHPGEEKTVLDIYKELLGKFSSLKLLIAPRHPERSVSIAGLIKNAGFSPLRVSLLDPRTREPANPRTVFILDMIGELINYYAIADIVFVGGSLVKKGGHNILEPAALAKPVLFGPYMFNFRDIAGLFLSVQAAIAVRNPQELKDKISDLLAHPELAAQLGGRARETLFKHQGASRKNLEFLSFFLPQV